MRKKGYLLILVLVIVLTGCGKKQEDIVTSEMVTESVIIEEKDSKETMQTEAAVIATIEVETLELPSGEGTGTIEDIPLESDNDKTDQKDMNAIEGPESGNADKTEETIPVEVEVNSEGCDCAYAEYLAKSPAEQQDYMNTFASPMDFIAWCKTAEVEHSSHTTVIEASGGDLDLSDYIK